MRKISAYFCFTKEIHWTTHFYSFGSKFKETKTVDGPPPSHFICNSWKYSKKTRDGPLINKADFKTYHTDNKVNYEYTWPTSNSRVVRNNYLTESIILYDFFEDTLSSPLIPMTNCHISVGHSTSQTMTIVWKVNKNKSCPLSMNLGTHNIRLHYNTSSLYRMEITTLGMSIHQWSVCPIRARHCFPKQLFCTFNGIYLVVFNCNELTKLTAFKPSKSFGELAKAHPDTPLAPLLNEIEDQLSDLIQKLDKQSRLLNCQLERALSIFANTVGKLFPWRY